MLNIYSGDVNKIAIRFSKNTICFHVSQSRMMLKTFEFFTMFGLKELIESPTLSLITF